MIAVGNMESNRFDWQRSIRRSDGRRCRAWRRKYRSMLNSSWSSHISVHRFLNVLRSERRKGSIAVKMRIPHGKVFLTGEELHFVFDIEQFRRWYNEHLQIELADWPNRTIWILFTEEKRMTTDRSLRNFIERAKFRAFVRGGRMEGQRSVRFVSWWTRRVDLNVNGIEEWRIGWSNDRPGEDGEEQGNWKHRWRKRNQRKTKSIHPQASSRILSWAKKYETLLSMLEDKHNNEKNGCSTFVKKIVGVFRCRTRPFCCE